MEIELLTGERMLVQTEPKGLILTTHSRAIHPSFAMVAALLHHAGRTRSERDPSVSNPILLANGYTQFT
jgi:hypothetical protein